MDDAAIRDALVRHWTFEGLDYDKSHEIYHDDAVLEFPQSGERFIGKQNFLTWRKKFPAKLDFKLRRITGRRDLWVTENLISYDGAPWMFCHQRLAVPRRQDRQGISVRDGRLRRSRLACRVGDEIRSARIGGPCRLERRDGVRPRAGPRKSAEAWRDMTRRLWASGSSLRPDV